MTDIYQFLASEFELKINKCRFSQAFPKGVRISTALAVSCCLHDLCCKLRFSAVFHDIARKLKVRIHDNGKE